MIIWTPVWLILFVAYLKCVVFEKISKVDINRIRMLYINTAKQIVIIDTENKNSDD